MEPIQAPPSAPDPTPQTSARVPDSPASLTTYLLVLIVGLQAWTLYLLVAKERPTAIARPASIPVPAAPIKAAESPVTTAPGAPGPGLLVQDDFNDDFAKGLKVPPLAVVEKSSPFSEINAKRPAASGHLTLRDRDIMAAGGEGGGFPPQKRVVLDFSDGMGQYVTFRFASPDGSPIGPGSTVSFDVLAFGGDGGHITKSISSDGSNFVTVGDASDHNGHFQFDIPPGGSEVFFRLQVGTTGGIFEGVQVGNFAANLTRP